MKVKIVDAVVTVSWGAVVTLRMESRAQARALKEHFQTYKSLQPYRDWEDYHIRGREPGFLADLGRAYYAFLDPPR